MTRTLKALGLALLAVCAFGAVAASSASAATDKITCTNHPEGCDITGAGTVQFATTFGTKSSNLTVTCENETFSASTANEATEVTVTPVYSGCRALSANDTDVDVGCTYVLNGTTTSNEGTTGSTKTDASVKLKCNHTGSIKVTVTGLCTITISDTHAGATVNQNLHGIAYHTTGTGETDDLEVKITVDKITYTTSGGLGCAFGGLKATGTDGILTGSATAKGYTKGTSHGTHVGLTDHSV